VTFLDGTVSGKREDEVLGVNIVTVDVTMTNQDGAVVASGPVDIELPS
jgi:hypothetical protein